MFNLMFSFTFAHCFAAPVLHVFSCQSADIETPELDLIYLYALLLFVHASLISGLDVSVIH